MIKRVLLLGSSGKMGTSLAKVFAKDGTYDLVEASSADFSAENLDSVRSIVKDSDPDVVINAVGLLGIDQCDELPLSAFAVNTVFPRELVKLANKYKFTLVHISTDAVFEDRDDLDFYVESDQTNPINLYGLSKLNADQLIAASMDNYYIARMSMLFGETKKNNQFIEKMLNLVKGGATELKIADDVICSPCYSIDAANKIKELLDNNSPYGLYHIANSGRASLYDLMSEIIKNLQLDVAVKKAYYKDFPILGKKNLCTPIKSEKIKPLRCWQDAIKEYCKSIKRNVL